MNKLPVQLFVGTPEATRAAVHTTIVAAFCAENSCMRCVPCKLVIEERHYNVWWFAPEGQQYTRAELEPLLSRLRILLEPNELFYIVITSADLLSTITATMLLKALEEPLPGYRFLLLTEQRELVLPTIVSRSVERACKAVVVYEAGLSSNLEAHEQLYYLLTRPTWQLLPTALKKLEAAGCLDQGMRKVLDELLRILVAQRAPLRELEHIVSAYDCLPLPGSGKLFWRNFLIQRVLLYENSTHSEARLVPSYSDQPPLVFLRS